MSINNISAKQKAEQLINLFKVDFDIQNAKIFALNCVYEILKAIDWHEFETPNKEIEYWNEVNIEIENY